MIEFLMIYNLRIIFKLKNLMRAHIHTQNSKTHLYIHLYICTLFSVTYLYKIKKTFLKLFH